MLPDPDPLAPEAPVPVLGGWDTCVGVPTADGVNTELGLAIHELATAEAEEVAAALTVPFPAKLQAIAFRFCDS